jgi:FixJ family two-component response regulator
MENENSGLNIAVIDDDPSIMSAVQRLLNAAGFKVEAYNSAESYLAANVQPNCVVTAIHLSGLSGFALRRVLMLDKTPPPPFIFITAFDEPEARVEAAKIGASGYLTEPFTSADLISTIHKATCTPAPNSPNDRARCT